MKNKNIKLELTPAQAATVMLVMGRLPYSVASSDIYEKFADALGQNARNNNYYRVQTIITIKGLEKAVEEVLELVGLTDFDFDSLPHLPKGVAYFTYPLHGSGPRAPRLLKVENEDSNYIAGYEIDQKTGVMSWDYKNFKKSLVRGLQRK